MSAWRRWRENEDRHACLSSTEARLREVDDLGNVDAWPRPAVLLAMRSFLAVVVFCAGSAFAQPYLVKDIRTAGKIDGSSSPFNFVPFRSALYFGTNPTGGAALWRTDGTTATKVGDGYAGSLTPLGDKLIYSGGSALFVSDGTARGTRAFADVRMHSGDTGFVESHGRLLFVNIEDSGSDAVWWTDGTNVGRGFTLNSPVSVKLIGRFNDRAVLIGGPGLSLTDGTESTTLSAGLASAEGFVAAGNQFFFASGAELWVSDGTPAGTHITKKIGQTSSYAGPPIAFGNRVLFQASDGTTAIWISDGTADGTVKLKNLYVSGGATLNGTAYFAGDESGLGKWSLWRTDGTPAGTQAIAPLPGNAIGFAAAAGRLWMVVQTPAGAQLVVSDGTAAGTRVLPATGVRPQIAELHGRAYFSAFDDAHGQELWSSDGTPEGTARLADIAPNIAPSAAPYPFAASSSHVLSVVYGEDFNIWTSDGTEEGTKTFPYPFYNGTRFGDAIYFTQSERGDLFRTDGTPEGTQQFLSFGKDHYAGLMRQIGDLLYFNVAEQQLWATDGTREGTRQVASGYIEFEIADWGGRLAYLGGGGLNVVDLSTPPRQIASVDTFRWLTVAGGRIVFAAGYPSKLYVSDGTTEGTQSIAELSQSYLLGTAGKRVLFANNDGVHGVELWSTDGTTAGTRLVADIFPGATASNPNDPAQLDGRVLFMAHDGIAHTGLWSSDGTPEGTYAIPGLTPYNIVAAKGRAFLRADDGLRGRELWQSDGTPQGTMLVGDIAGGPASSDPVSMTVTTDLLFFQARTVETGAELWALPVPWRTIAIANAHAPSSASSATMTVSLDAPATAPVSATWTSSSGASGSIVFAPGERRKTISFAVTPDPATRSNRFVDVALRDIRGAIATKSTATLIVERAAARADLRVKVRHGSAPRTRDVVVENLGPDAVPSVKETLFNSSYFPDLPYANETLFKRVPAGQSAVLPRGLATVSAISAVSVTSSVDDPDPSNNMTTVALTTDASGIALSISPAALLVGGHATLTVDDGSGSAFQLTSSNPSVIAVPATAANPSDLDVVALTPGTTTLTAASGSRRVSLDVLVQPAGAPFRWPAQMTFSIDNGERRFGAPQHLVAKIAGFAWDAGVRPSGTITFRDGDTVIATAAVGKTSTAETLVDSLLPGTHTITASYAGDEHYLADSATAPPIVIGSPLPVTFYGTYDPRTATTAELTIAVKTPPAVPARGTITLKDGRDVIAADVPVVNGIARVVTKRLDFVTVFYSGDDLYEPAVVNVLLTPVRRRVSP